jgi:hypothetical protein
MPKIGIYVMSDVHFTIFIFNTAWAPKKLFSAGAEVTAKLPIFGTYSYKKV